MAADPPACPRGLVCPVLSPLRTDGTLDTRSFGALLLRIRDAVDAVLVGDPIWGEGLRLDDATRRDAITVSLEVIAGQVPILVAATGTTVEEKLRLVDTVTTITDRMAYTGALFWVDYPLVHHSNRELPRLCEALSAGTSAGWILGNHPELVGIRKGPARHKNIRTAVLKKLSENKAVRAMIFNGSIKRSLNYQQAVRSRQDFVFYDGDESVFLKNPGTGGPVAGGSNLLPEGWRDITRSSLNRYDLERQYRSHQQQIWDVGVMLKELHALYRAAPAFYLKRLLHRLGLIDSAHCLEPPAAPEPDWDRKAGEWLARYDM